MTYTWTDPITLPCSLARAGNNTASARLTVGLLMFNALIQLKKYNIDDGSGGSDVGM